MKNMCTRVTVVTAAAFTAAFTPLVAEAHTLGATGAGFTAGIVHPLAGVDHLLAMLAVGLCAGMRGGVLRWSAPLAFLAAMALGAVLALGAVGLPLVETGIAGSVLVFGLLLGLRAKLPVWLGLAVVAVFALLHGHAHGTELPQAASAIGYSIGFLLSSAALLAAGVVVASLLERPRLAWVARGGGVGVAVAGAGMLVGA